MISCHIPAKALRKQQDQTVDMLFKSYTFLINLNWLDYISGQQVHSRACAARHAQT
jgi:hypothetical protein